LWQDAKWQGENVLMTLLSIWRLGPLIIGLLPAMLIAGSRNDLDNPTLAAMINDSSISVKVAHVMHAVATTRRPEATLNDAIAAMVEDRLLAHHARARYAMDDLLEKTQVGYVPAIQIEESVVASLQAAYGTQIAAAIKAEKGGTLNGIVTGRYFLTASDWNAVLGEKPRLLLVYELSQVGRKEAAAKSLVSYRLGGESGVITLLDVYDAQHVQGRNRLHNRDNAYAMQQAELLLERRYVQHWARYRSGLSATDYQVFRQAIEDSLVREGWLSLIGVAADMHDENQHLKTLALAVSPDEVKAYYQQHQDQFKRIERVKAAHIRLSDIESANKAYTRLKGGESFAAVAREMSIAKDRDSGGDLGWIEHGEKNVSWLESVAFVQVPGVISRPIRSPGVSSSEVAWEILKVDERVEGYQPVDSESVRYVAAQALAKQKALVEYKETRERLLNEADVRLNPSILASGKARQP
jgi:hypothetical protein